MANPQFSNAGSFIPTTFILDTQQFYETEVNSEEFRELIVRLAQNLNNIALVLNTKDTGYYPAAEFVNSQLFFPNPTGNTSTMQGNAYRQVFRTTVNFGALPNATTKSVAHNINISTTIPSTYSFTRIYGAASKPDQTSFIPLPYSSLTLLDNIELHVTDTNVVVTTGIDYSAWTITYIVVEYLQN